MQLNCYGKGTLRLRNSLPFGSHQTLFDWVLHCAVRQDCTLKFKLKQLFCVYVCRNLASAVQIRRTLVPLMNWITIEYRISRMALLSRIRTWCTTLFYGEITFESIPAVPSYSTIHCAYNLCSSRLKWMEFLLFTFCAGLRLNVRGARFGECCRKVARSVKFSIAIVMHAHGWRVIKCAKLFDTNRLMVARISANITGHE